MKFSTVIIVGGGPAGSACARVLRKKGLGVRILDKKPFPRQKICAGWITPEVLDTLDIQPEDYPYLIKRFNRLHYYLLGVHVPVKTRQYAIRRYEFDHWMLKRSKVPVETHAVKKITRTGSTYVIDNTYECQYLIGAGGTHCPVYKTFFKSRHPRHEKALISAVEKEYQCHSEEKGCHLWFFDGKLPGYAWFVPKGNGWINIGIGGKAAKLKARGKTIMDHWRLFIQKLMDLSFVKEAPPHPKGHTYYLYHGRQPCRMDNIFIIGDAAGGSTLDMGEGICAAVKSGISAAVSISDSREFKAWPASKFSLPGILMQMKHAGEKRS